MDAKPIIMTVSFQARPGKEAELREALTEVLMPTRQEDGCLFYDMHVAADDPSKFLFHESWASNAHHDAHDRTPHIQVARPRTPSKTLVPNGGRPHHILAA
jgi:quinol monooxygenase YgiN